MSFPFPWPVIFAVRGPGFGAESEPTPGADATAWTLIALLLFCLIGFVFGLLAAKKHRRKDSLTGEFQDKSEAVPRKEKHEPWQKPEDWWKK